MEFSAEEFETALLNPNDTLSDIHIPLLKVGALAYPLLSFFLSLFTCHSCLIDAFLSLVGLLWFLLVLTSMYFREFISST